MNSTQNLQSELSQFFGTEKFYRITKRHLLTDGTKYLAEQAKCFWLMDAISSHLPKYFIDYFCVARLVVCGSSAVLTLDNENDNI
jgi:hypothetical protein